MSSPYLKTRRFRNRQIWQKGYKGNEDSYVVYIVAEDDETISEEEKHELSSAGIVLGSTYAIVLLEPLAPRITKVTNIQTTDLNISGSVGVLISNIVASYLLSFLEDVTPNTSVERTR